jgi:hypothetical protein
VKCSTKCWWLSEVLLVGALFVAHYGPAHGWYGLVAGILCAVLGVLAITVAGIAGSEGVREGDP